MKKFFKRTGLLLAAAFIDAAAMQAKISSRYGPLYRCPDEANDRRGENRAIEPAVTGENHYRASQKQ